MNVKLVVIDGKRTGMEIPVSTAEFLIGRGRSCQLRPGGPRVGRRHCTITVGKESVAIEDCGSGKGTWLNGKLLQWRRELHHGDRITIGAMVFEVRLDMEEGRGRSQGPSVERGAALSGMVASDEDVKVVEWVEDGEASARAIARSGCLSSPVSDSCESQRGQKGNVVADVPSECVGRDRRTERLDGHTAHAKMDLIDLALLTSIALLGVVVLILLLPVFAEAGPVVRRMYRALVTFRRWPWWIWTSCGVLLLGILLWLRERWE